MVSSIPAARRRLHRTRARSAGPGRRDARALATLISRCPHCRVHDVEAVMVHVRALAVEHSAEYRAVRADRRTSQIIAGALATRIKTPPEPARMRARGTPRRSGACVPRRAVDHRDGVIGGPGPDPPGEPARQAHQAGVVAHRWPRRRCPRASAATRPGTRRCRHPSGSRRSARSGPRSHTSRSAAPEPRTRSHLPSADREGSAAAPAARLPGGATRSGRSPGRNVGKLGRR